MGTVTKYISSTSFLEKTFAYLKAHHGVCPVLVDENGHPEPLNGDVVQEFSIARYYPVAFEKNVGGIRCSAETEAELNAAEPYIHICIDGLQEILLKDWILRQATDEMLDGQGYPLGLTGESISPFARIIAVADVFDALIRGG